MVLRQAPYCIVLGLVTLTYGESSYHKIMVGLDTLTHCKSSYGKHSARSGYFISWLI